MIKLTKQQKDKLTYDMLDFLFKEMALPQGEIENARATLNALMLLNTNFPLGEYFYSLQDRLLTNEAREREIITKFDGKTKKLNFCYIKADMLVYFGEKLLRGDVENCIENNMVLSSGVQINEDFYNIFKQNGFIINYSAPYITYGYNLNCDYIAKIVLGDAGLEQCINETLKFISKNKLKNIAIYVGNNQNLQQIFINAAKQFKNVKLLFVCN